MTKRARPTWRTHHRALGHVADVADVALATGRHDPPVVAEPPPGVRFVDRQQVVRYRAETEAEARALAAKDAPVAAEAGFVPVDAGHWEEQDGRTALVVVYRAAPPARLRRTIETDARTAAVDGAADAVAMAAVGYVPVSETWHGRTFGGFVETLLLGANLTYGWMGHGSLEIEYRYDPELAGDPVAAIVLTDEHRRTHWWVLDEVPDPR